MKKILLTAGLISVLSSTAYGSNTAQGKQLSASCAGCHGDNGISLSQNYPNLAGQKNQYLITQLKAFKNGSRKNATMTAMTSALSEQDIVNISAYYSSLKAMPVATLSKNTPQATGVPTRTDFPKSIYVTNKKSGTVEQLPNEITWKGGPNMLYVAITPNKNRVLATSPSTNTVYVFNAQTGHQIKIINVQKAPKGVKVSPNGRWAYVANQGAASVSVINLKTLKVVNTIKVKSEPHNIRFTSNGKLAYVTLQGGAGLAVIDTAKQKMIKVIPVPGITGPHNLDLTHNEKYAYVRDFVHHVALINLKTGNVKKVFTVGNGHGGMDVSPNGEWAATAAIGDTFCTIINTKTLKTYNIQLGTASHGIRASKNNRWLYVTLPKANALAVISLKTKKIIKKIPMGQFPFWITVNGNP